MPPGCWKSGLASGEVKTGCTGWGWWSLAKTEAGANRVTAVTAGGTAELGNRNVEAGRSQKHIRSPAQLRVEALGDAVTNRPTPPQLRDSGNLLTIEQQSMDRPNDPPDHRIVQRLMRMAGCLSWLTEPLEEITPEVQWLRNRVPPRILTRRLRTSS